MAGKAEIIFLPMVLEAAPAALHSGDQIVMPLIEGFQHYYYSMRVLIKEESDLNGKALLHQNF